MDQLERGGGMYKKVLSITVRLLLLQLLRMGAKGLVFQVLKRTIWTDEIVSCLFMLVFAVLIFTAARKKHIDLHLFPETFSLKYKISTAAVLVFWAITPVITRSFSPADLLSLVYHTIITVAFEEILFRGFVYQAISQGEKERTAWGLSTLLFGIWHLGYVDTVLWRTSLFFPNANLVQIMFWKVVTGLVIGALLGLFRYKSGNVYTAMLVHTFINTFGG